MINCTYQIIFWSYVMFDNIGGKIKGVAKVVTWLGIIGSCLAGLVLLVQGLEYDEEIALYGILLAGLGSLFSCW